MQGNAGYIIYVIRIAWVGFGVRDICCVCGATIFVAIKRHTTINLLNRANGIKRKAVRKRSFDGILSHLIF